MPKSLGLDPSALKTITCKSCTHRIEYSLGEIRLLYSGKDYSGGSDGAEGFNCPNCRKQIITRAWWGHKPPRPTFALQTCPRPYPIILAFGPKYPLP